MDKITKKNKRIGCLPYLARIYPWNKKSEKKQVKADVTARNEDKTYKYGSSFASKNRSLRRKEVTKGKPDQEQEVVAELVEEEDGEFRDKSLVHDSSDAHKNSSLREKEVISREDKEMPYDDSFAFDESSKVMETQKHENADNKLKVEQGSESVDVDKQALPNFGAWESIQSTEDLENIFKPCSVRRRGAINDEFSKVKTFDLRGVSNSSDKGLKPVAWSRLFQSN